MQMQLSQLLFRGIVQLELSKATHAMCDVVSKSKNNSMGHFDMFMTM